MRPRCAVAAGMVQRHFVVADDAVVEVGDVQRPVRTEADIDRTEPAVVAREEVGLLDGRVAGTVPLEPIVIDAVGDQVADEQRVAKLRREVIGRVVDDAGNAGRAVAVAAHLRTEAQPVVRLAEAGVACPSQQHVERASCGSRPSRDCPADRTPGRTGLTCPWVNCSTCEPSGRRRKVLPDCMVMAWPSAPAIVLVLEKPWQA